VREQFEAMGRDERVCWGEFVRRVDGRLLGKAGGGSGGRGMSKSGNGCESGGGDGVNLHVGRDGASQQQQVMVYHGPVGTLLQGVNVVQEASPQTRDNCAVKQSV